jgi:BolA protein
MNVQETIEAKLRQELQPEFLEVRNVSDHHASHAGSPGTGESHFEVTVASTSLEGLSRVQRHKRVYAILAEEVAGPVHALQLTFK